MLSRFLLAALLLGTLSASALAQAPPAAAPSAHALPFPGATPELHAVELALGGAAEAGLTVRVASAPPWLRFELPEAEALALTGESAKTGEPVARLAFSVARSAPVGEAATVELVVTNAAGLERARHAFAVVVSAPELSLVAPRPNPSRGGAVRVSVVDVLGREVAVLASGELAAGAHAVRVPSLASGTYVVRLAGEDAVRTERFTVVR